MAMRSFVFLNIKLAPRDGTVTEVWHVPDQEIAQAKWRVGMPGCRLTIRCVELDAAPSDGVTASRAGPFSLYL
jgi:hypothetical protein